MGYDSFECFECYNGGGRNNICDDEGKHLETCLTCIDKICGHSTQRVIYALKNFDWDPSGRCTECNKEGITVAILLCDYHVTERKFLNEESNDYECYLCDYEGHHNYIEDDPSEKWDQLPYCDACATEVSDLCTKRTRGTFEQWSGCGYNGTCSRCKSRTAVEELPLCNHHTQLTQLI